ncbi:MAG: site-specific integrase [Bacteroidales bacterium]|nr:site-specific integrase [Bacteroidales bacterium]
MDSNVKITYWLYKTRTDKISKLCPIYLRVRNNNSFFTKSTGLSVRESDWDKKLKRVKGKSAEAESINSQLDGLRHKIMQITNQLTIKGKPFSVELIKKHMEGKEEHQMTLMKVYDEHLRQMKRLKGKEYQQPTIIKYANTRLRLSQFLKFKFRRSDMFLYELNYDFMKGFEIFLRERFDNSTTTCYKHYQRLTRVLKIAMQKGYLDRHPFPAYRIRMPKKKIEYLEREELDRIECTDFKVERLNVIRDIFIFCCYTGLGYAEVASLSLDDLVTGADGEKWLNILRKKTQKPYSVPVLPKAYEIMDKYLEHPLCRKRGRLLPVPSNVKYNAYLKEIAVIAGVKKHLVSHLARKTFATTIMLANGVNIGIVSRLLGHANVQVTLDAYGEYNDQLMISQVGMIREKLAANNDEFRLVKMEDKSAIEQIVKDFNWREKDN